MNTLCSPRSGRILSFAFTALWIGSTAIASANDTPEPPSGTLKVDRDLVRVGMKSQLDWEIEYPLTGSNSPGQDGDPSGGVTDLIDIVPPQRIVPKKELIMRVRVLGVAFQSGSKQMPLDAYISYNGSSWNRFFYGRSYDVEPGDVLVERTVSAGTTIDFGARGWINDWLPFHSTDKEDQYLKVLKNGDIAPSYAPAYSQGDIVSFLGPYMDDRGKVRIGDRDLIILWEAYTGEPGSKYFDMQDLVVLVTFE